MRQNRGRTVVQLMVIILLMLDYYFCEECETYHEPNRIINGEILSACECEISTQSNTKQSRDTCEADMMTTTPIKNVYASHGTTTSTAQTGVRFQYQSPPRIQPTQTVRHISKERKQVNNFPFLTITPQQNQQQVRRFIVNSPSRQQPPIMSPRFVSPQQAKQELPLRKVAVNPRLNALIPVKQPTIRLQQIRPIQAIRPLIVMARTPIQTIGQLTEVHPAEALPETKLSIEVPSHEEYSIKIIEASPEPQSKGREVKLDRVSGYTFADHDEIQQARISSNQRVSLDRVAAQYGAINESDQKSGCCACYH